MEDQQETIRRHYNMVATEYDGGYDNVLNRAEDLLITKIMAPYTGNSILDMGCGTGLLLEYTPPTSLEYYLGVDIAEDMLEKARSKFPHVQFIQEDMHNIPVAESSFDTVACLYGTFSYSQKPMALLGEMRRVLKPGGHAIIMPYSKRVKHRIFLGYCAKSQDSSLHVNYYSPELLEQLSAQNFLVREVHGINYLGNIIGPVVEAARRVNESIPSVGYEYLASEHNALQRVNKAIDNLLVHGARHIMLIAQLKEDSLFY